MCEPVSITMGVMAVAGATTSIIAQNNARQAAKGMENYKRITQDNLILENRQRATKDYINQVRLERTQQAQEQVATTEQVTDINKQAVATKGTALASAAERGVSGASVDAVLSDYQTQQNLAVGRLQYNQQLKNQQHGENITNDTNTYYNRASYLKPYVPQPQAPVDYFTPILGGLSSVGGSMAKAGLFSSAPAPSNNPAGAPNSADFFGPANH